MADESAFYSELGDTFVFPDGRVVWIDYASPLAVAFHISDGTGGCFYYRNSYEAWLERERLTPIGKQHFVARTDPRSGGDYICG